MTKPGCTLTATLHSKPEKRDELLALIATFIEKSRNEPGCLEYNLQISRDDPNVFMFYENWVEREDLEAHMRLPYQQEWFKLQSDLLTKPAELKFYDLVGTLAR
jgi:quinol monooxygenase YgiN